MSKIEELIKKHCPDGVEYKALGEIGEFYGGLTGKSKSDFTDGNAKFITYKNIFNNPSLDLDITDTVKIGENERQNEIQYGDVLFTGSSETPDECGMSSVVTMQPNEKFFLNSFCFGFRLFDAKMFLPDYLKHLFRSHEIRKQIFNTASGVTRFNVSKKRFANVSIPVPPLPVQEEIVRILDKFTTLEAELEAELDCRKRQYEYYRDKLLNKSKSENEYKRVKLGEIGRVCMCKRVLKEQTTNIGDIPFYKIGTFGKEADAFISKELYEDYKSKYSFPKKGDVLISASGTIGRSVIYDGEPAYYQDSNIVWIANDESKALNKWLFYCYKMSPWKVSTGGTISRLYNDNIANAEIPLPPLAVQERIVNVLDNFEQLCNDLGIGLPAEIEARKKQYEYYRNKLLSFRGGN